MGYRLHNLYVFRTIDVSFPYIGVKMPTKSPGTMKNLDLGPFKARVDRIAERDPVLKSSAAVIRAAIAEYVERWEAEHPGPAETKRQGESARAAEKGGDF